MQPINLDDVRQYVACAETDGHQSDKQGLFNGTKATRCRLDQPDYHLSMLGGKESDTILSGYNQGESARGE